MEPEKNCILTRCKIWSSDRSRNDNSIPIPDDLLDPNDLDHKYMLGIFAPAKDFLKITTYFLKKPYVSKITLSFDKIDPDLIKKVSILIKEFNEKPIHVSGFCNKHNKYIYEIYAPDDKESINNLTCNLDKLGIPFKADIQKITLSDEA